MITNYVYTSFFRLSKLIKKLSLINYGQIIKPPHNMAIYTPLKHNKKCHPLIRNICHNVHEWVYICSMDNKIENTMEYGMKQHINEYHYNLVPSHDNIRTDIHI